MPVAKAKTNKNGLEDDFLKDVFEKLLVVNQRLDMRAYPTLGIATLVFVLALFNILDKNKTGLVGFLIIAGGCLITDILAWYAIRNGGLSYTRILLNSAVDLNPQRFSAGVRRLTQTKTGMTELYRWRVLSLIQSAEAKKKVLDAAVSILVASLLVGLILIVALP